MFFCYFGLVFASCPGVLFSYLVFSSFLLCALTFVPFSGSRCAVAIVPPPTDFSYDFSATCMFSASFWLGFSFLTSLAQEQIALWGRGRMCIMCCGIPGVR